jgi:HD-GYP domain-containing protein (c-di-GMP phosphodiesterase class II)
MSHKAIGLDMLLTNTLPGVSLFLKHNANFVLYKAPDLPFTEHDKERLIKNNVSQLYVYERDLADYNQYVESNLATIMSDVQLSPQKKQEVLCQAAVNYVEEIFSLPAKYIKENLNRCIALIQYILNDKLSVTELVNTLGNLVQHSSYTYVHSVQVSSYMIALHSQATTMDKDELIDVGIGSLFHDYGKLYIPQSILDKPDKLSPLEFYEIKKHSEYGYNALKMLDTFSPLALGIVKHHHEKMNGRGYPEGLHSDEIARSSKMAAICDVYSALTTNRAYRQALDKEAALRIMHNEMEGSFDLYYLSAFVVLVGG